MKITVLRNATIELRSNKDVEDLTDILEMARIYIKDTDIHASSVMNGDQDKRYYETILSKYFDKLT